MRFLTGSFAALLVAVAMTSLTFAAEQTSPPDSAERAQSSSTAPELLTMKAPKYPTRELNSNREAWLLVHYTIKADGTTTDATVTDGFYDPAFEKSALDALASAKYRPATDNGQPVDYQEANVITFIMGDRYAGLTGEVSKGYDRALKLVEQKDFDGARALVQTLLSSSVKTLVDFAVVQELLCHIEVADNHLPEALVAIERATMRFGSQRVERRAPLGSRLVQVQPFPRHYMMVPAATIVALHERLAVETALRRYAGAEKVLDMLEELGGVRREDLQTKTTIDAAIESPAPIVSPSKIINGSWQFQPSRRSFTIANVQGELHRIRVSCTYRPRKLSMTAEASLSSSLILDYRPDYKWTLPTTDCHLRIAGTEGTIFDIVELQDLPSDSSAERSSAATSKRALGVEPAKPPRPVAPQFWTAPEDPAGQ